jgi:conjugal transfer pilus assembly protein TraI
MLKRILKPISSVLNDVFYGGYPSSKSCEDDAPYSSEENSSPRYPPLDQGLEFIPVKLVLASQKPLIDRIQKTAGLPPAEFLERFLPVIENLSRYIHLLPATRTSHHRGAGGLFRLSLEMGLYSLQIANATIFSSGGSVSAEMRYKQHPQWVYATFVAGICAELYRPITNMVVTNDDGDQWPQLLIPLYDWSEDKKDKRYFVVWNVQDETKIIAMHQTTAAYILNVIVPMSGLQYLNKNNTEIMASMTSCVTNTVAVGTQNQMNEIIKSVRKKVIERDLNRNSERYGDFTVGSHLEPHLLDAMRKLVRKKTWEVNAKGARIWYSKEGMFIVWLLAAREIIGVLKDDNKHGVPNEPDTLADILISSGIAESNKLDGRYWEICIPSSMQILPALKLINIEVLFNNDTDIEPLNTPLLPANIKPAALNTKSNAGANTAQMPLALEVEETKPTSDSSDESKQVIRATDDLKPLMTSAPEIQDTKLDVPVQSKSAVNESGGVLAEVGKSQTPVATKMRNEPTTEITHVVKTTPPLSEEGQSSDRVFQSLPDDVADYLRAIVEDHQDGSSGGPVFSTNDGVAISVKELENHGQANFTGLVKTLYEKTWLWTDPDKPMRMLIDLPFQGNDTKVIVIRKEIARSMGFKWDKPKRGV